MRNLVILLMFMSFSFLYAQEDKSIKIEKKGDLTLATYYHDNGEVQQQGTFNAKGELHGEWISYDNQGNKLAVGNYDNGKKVGKWFFWHNDTLKEVDYLDSKIINVNSWNSSDKVVSN